MHELCTKMGYSAFVVAPKRCIIETKSEKKILLNKISQSKSLMKFGFETLHIFILTARHITSALLGIYMSEK